MPCEFNLHFYFHVCLVKHSRSFLVWWNRFSNRLISVLINEEVIVNHILCFRRELEEEVNGESTFDAETMICAGRLNGHGNACYVCFVIFRHFFKTHKYQEVNNHIGGSSPREKSPHLNWPCVRWFLTSHKVPCEVCKMTEYHSCVFMFMPHLPLGGDISPLVKLPLTMCKVTSCKVTLWCAWDDFEY